MNLRLMTFEEMSLKFLPVSPICPFCQQEYLYLIFFFFYYKRIHMSSCSFNLLSYSDFRIYINLPIQPSTSQRHLPTYSETFVLIHVL